jgi:hypothetical protein
MNGSSTNRTNNNIPSHPEMSVINEMHVGINTKLPNQKIETPT